MGLEGSRGFGPFHFKPKAHAEEEEVPEDEWRYIYIYIYISVCEKLLSLAIYFSERGLLGKFYINKNKF